MTDFVTRDDDNLGVGRILTSPTMYALYDNLFAVASGAAGAPRIQDASLSTTVTTAGTDWVLARTAAASVGAAGTYAFLRPANNVTYGPGDTLAGSSLRYSGAPRTTFADLTAVDGDAPPGTWRCMGNRQGLDSPTNISTLWLRIS